MFNDQDLAILHILGNTPSFKGVKTRSFDTPIVMAKQSMRATTSNAKACNAEVVASTSNITQSINTGMALNMQTQPLISRRIKA